MIRESVEPRPILILLRRYRTELPGTLMSGLKAITLEFYKEFKVRDMDADKLLALHLPVTGEGRIELSFRGAPAARVDALQILSEGHVRCLGLSTMLATRHGSPLKWISG